jgi:glycerophosphoryl diester phosphodiesterase/pimeloyl-ACP methyl ester carboxylesterase
MVFFGGLATSVRAFELTEFARSLREKLALRAISVERNGLGETPLDPSLGIGDTVDDVLSVLEAVAIDRFAVVAISGGGPYAGALAARVPDRLISLHLAAAAVGGVPVGDVPRDPVEMWRYPPDSPVLRIPGFAEAAAAEGKRALALNGLAALDHEFRLLRDTALPSLEAVTAPTYLYYGTGDELVPLAHADAWRKALDGPVTLRRYDGEGHDVQYTHWDQILFDVAGTPPSDTLVIAHRGAWANHPENTLEAFEEAIRLGADMVELDVRRTADGHLIAYHDPTGDRRRDELRGPPPLLDEVVKALAGRIALNIELKEGGCEAEVVALLTRFGADDCLVTSFLDDVVRDVKVLAPQLRTGLIIGGATAEPPLPRARRAGADCLVLESTLADAATAELPCFVWTVNEQEVIDRLLREPNVDGVITDEVALALSRRALLSGRTAPATPR